MVEHIKGAVSGARVRGATTPPAAGCSIEALEDRVLMAMSLKVGGSGFSNLLATDSAALRRQKLIIDPPEPLAGSTSTLYDATKVSLVGATPGPGYANLGFGGFVEIREGNTTRLQPIDGFLRQPAGVETGYVQIQYQLTSTPGKLRPPANWIQLDVGGTDGADTHALDFLRNERAVGANAYRVFAAKKGEHAGNEEDFLLTNDGTRTRLGPDQLSEAEATTAPKDGSIGGVVFEDFDGNGIENNDERGFEAVTVYLDLDRDGKPGDQEPKRQTNELGGYFFDDLDPGAYVVREVLPDGFVHTLARENGGIAVEVRPGFRERASFGNAKLANISGTVFNDLDNDGVRDAGEPGLAGVVVFLDLNTDRIFTPQTEPSDTSDAAGAWSFEGILPGYYYVRQIPPEGYFQTTPGSYYLVILPSGATVANLAFGDYFRPGPKVLDVFLRSKDWTAAFRKELARLGVGDGHSSGFRISSQGRDVPLLPWVNLNQVVIRFDQPVEVDAFDIVIRGRKFDSAGSGVELLAGLPNTYLFTVDRPLAGDGNSRFNGDRFVLDLNGDAPNGVRATPAGGSLYLDGDNDGRPGGDFVLPFDVLQGDVNRSGCVNVTDYAATLRRSGSNVDASRRYSVFHDLDGNGAINAQDAQIVRRRLGRSLPAVQLPAAGSMFGAPLPLQPARQGLFGDEPLAG